MASARGDILLEAHRDSRGYRSCEKSADFDRWCFRYPSHVDFICRRVKGSQGAKSRRTASRCLQRIEPCSAEMCTILVLCLLYCPPCPSVRGLSSPERLRGGVLRVKEAVPCMMIEDKLRGLGWWIDTGHMASIVSQRLVLRAQMMKHSVDGPHVGCGLVKMCTPKAIMSGQIASVHREMWVAKEGLSSHSPGQIPQDDVSHVKCIQTLLRLRGGMDAGYMSSIRRKRSAHWERRQVAYVPKCLLEEPRRRSPGEEGEEEGDKKRRSSGQRHHMQDGAGARPVRQASSSAFNIEALKGRLLSNLPADGPAPAESSDIDAKPQAPDLPLTREQNAALDFVRSGKSIFLTGSAGTGKSFVLKHVIKELKKRHGAAGVHVTASTGAAAVLIGGTTVHSFAGVGLGTGEPNQLAMRVHANKPCVNRWRRAKALVIDEVSMIDAELFQKINYVAQRVRDNHKPFGGLQLVLSGDFFQLPPVSDGLKKFAFESEAWDQAVERIVELKQVMRQGDGTFVRILNEVRWGNISLGSYNELIKCQNRPMSEQWSDGVAETKLHPYNVNVRAENERKLQSLHGEAMTYPAVDRVQNSATKGAELVKAGKVHQYTSRLDQMNVEKIVTLKVCSFHLCARSSSSVSFS